MLTERTQVLLTPAQRLRLEKLAAERSVSIGYLIREAIDSYASAPVRSRREALDDLVDINAPVDDWETMKAEILRGAIA
ncbi:MAG: hypothetical protein ACRDWA_08730 [Acidimicrobiia bacterium]